MVSSPGASGFLLQRSPPCRGGVDYVLPSHNVGLECRGFGVGSFVSCRWAVVSESQKTVPAEIRPDGPPADKQDAERMEKRFRQEYKRLKGCRPPCDRQD